MCESPSDLPLLGKVLAATRRAVDPAICHRHGELRGGPAGKQAGARLAPEGVRKACRFSTDGPRRMRNCSDMEFLSVPLVHDGDQAHR